MANFVKKSLPGNFGKVTKRPSYFAIVMDYTASLMGILNSQEHFSLYLISSLIS